MRTSSSPGLFNDGVRFAVPGIEKKDEIGGRMRSPSPDEVNRKRLLLAWAIFRAKHLGGGDQGAPK
jgi:hypothetical protein